jgi:spoIIIJ-associated protein
VSDVQQPRTIEAEGAGETVGEARWAALRELERIEPGLDRGTVQYVVLSEGERGLLGLGREPARVIARAQGGADASAAATQRRPRAATTPSDADVSGLSDEAQHVRRVVDRIVGAMADDFEVHVRESDEAITATVEGPSAGIVIGRHGHTIDAVQHLVAAIVFPVPQGRREVIVDAQGYRARRERTLRDVAARAADDAVREGCPMELDPMSSAERKIVHLALADRSDVETSSEGREPARFVVISPLKTS